MSRHFHEELEALKQTLLAMGGLVEDQIRRVMRALLDRDDTMAQEVIDRDRQVNAYDVEVDERCVELLALHQPAAGDLRFITTAMKIVTDLERIGDQAVNIAHRVLELNQQPRLKPYIDLPRMAEQAQRMVKESLDAFVARDPHLARRVCAADDAVDGLRAGHPPDPNLALLRAGRRPRHEHRRDGHLPGRGPHGPAHAGLSP
jgi:phosphate transport system protein